MLNAFFKNKVRFYDEDQFHGFVHNDLSTLDQVNTNSLHQTPKGSFFISNVGEVLDSVDTWKSHLPNVGMFFKVSANPDPVLIRILNCYGIKFSCSTGPEIENLISHGVPSSSIIYSGLCKLSRHIRTASIHNINYICFGTIAELKRIISIQPKAKLFLRFNLDMSCVSDNCPINLAATGLTEIRTILAYSSDVKASIYGLHFDLPENSTPEIYENAFKLLNNIISVAKNEFGFDIMCVNIGSGVPLFNHDEDSLFSDFARETNQFANDHPQIELIAEPGEFVVKNAVKLCCSVVGIREVNDSSGEKTMFYYLNDGLYGSLSSILYRQYEPELVILRQNPFDDQESFTNHRASFWGPTCDSMDKICTIDDFPDLSVGDLVVFKNVGLYGRACASTFNGFNLAKNCHVISYQRLESLGIDRETADLSRERYAHSVMA